MKIEKLEVSQHLDTRKLYEEVFSEDEKSFVDYYYQEKTKDNIIYIVREDDDIQAMLHLNPYTLMVNGTERNPIILWQLQRERNTVAEVIWPDF